jgi:hypothetical protein
MAQLLATALTLVNAPTEVVHAALSDYADIRPALLTKEFDGYQVLAGGHGAGTEVRWTVALSEALRNKKGKRPRTPKHPPREFVVLVDESDPEQIVERDTHSDLVTVWTLRADGDRTAVRVRTTWDNPGGMLARQGEQLAMRTVLEGVLTKLHDYFQPDEDDDDETESAESSESAEADPGDGPDPGRTAS